MYWDILLCKKLCLVINREHLANLFLKELEKSMTTPEMNFFTRESASIVRTYNDVREFSLTYNDTSKTTLNYNANIVSDVLQ